LLHVMLYRAFRRETNEIASFCMLFVVGKTLRAPAVPCCGLPEVKFGPFAQTPTTQQHQDSK
jgi:hypothetical protein